MLVRFVALMGFMVLPFAVLSDIHVTRRFLGENCEMPFIDWHGNAVEHYVLGEFDLVDTKLPLYAYWTSAADPSKSLLGYGWHVPWLECCMLPVSVKTYELRSMFGERLRFVRDSRNPELFRYHDVACAVVGKDDIKLYLGKKPGNAPDMVFLGGRLVQFRYASRTVKIEYESGCFRRMTSGGKTILSADRKSSEPNVIRVVFNGDKRGAAVVRTGKKSVCVGCPSTGPKFEVRETLVELCLPSQERLEFSYGDRGEIGGMSDGKAKVVWDPGSRKLLVHDDWAYDLSQHDPDNGVCRLRREMGGDVEEFSYDAKSGRRVRLKRGIRDTSRLFTSGKLRGKVRWNERTLPGGNETRTEYSYDEKQRLVYYRLLDKKSGSCSESWNDENGRIIRFRLNGDDSTDVCYRYSSDGSRTVERKIVQEGDSSVK